MDRYWLLTTTTYGTWLPGDERGCVSNIDRGDGKGHRLNKVGTPAAPGICNLHSAAEAAMHHEAVLLNANQAKALLEQFRETAEHRGWELCAVAIMRNHVHWVLGVPGDPEPESLLRDLKSYGSRRLNVLEGMPQGTRWWTQSGSRRKLATEAAVRAAIVYVRDQEFPLVVAINPRWESDLTSGIGEVP